MQKIIFLLITLTFLIKALSLESIISIESSSNHPLVNSDSIVFLESISRVEKADLIFDSSFKKISKVQSLFNHRLNFNLPNNVFSFYIKNQTFISFHEIPLFNTGSRAPPC